MARFVAFSRVYGRTAAALLLLSDSQASIHIRLGCHCEPTLSLPAMSTPSRRTASFRLYGNVEFGREPRIRIYLQTSPFCHNTNMSWFNISFTTTWYPGFPLAFWTCLWAIPPCLSQQQLVWHFGNSIGRQINCDRSQSASGEVRERLFLQPGTHERGRPFPNLVILVCNVS